jgi:hypothetical protein
MCTCAAACASLPAVVAAAPSLVGPLSVRVSVVQWLFPENKVAYSKAMGLLSCLTSLLVALAMGSIHLSNPVQALDNGVGRTPLMGWMAWVRFRCNIECDVDPENCISEKLFRDMADVMVSGGWRDAGYTYLSLDDCWQAKERAADGSIVADPKRFPSGMKALGDYIHSKGLLFGMYTAMGAKSCCGYPAFGCRTAQGGGCEQARRDVQTYVSWGIDYIKVDSCKNATGGPEDGSQFNTTHPLVSSYFLQYGKAAKRPVLYHPSGIALRQNEGDRHGGQGPHPHQFRLYSKIANMWRAYKDMQPVWSEVNQIIDYWAADNETAHPRTYANEWEDWLSVSRPGVFQDPDALLVGNANTSSSCNACDAPHTACKPGSGAPCICCGSLSPDEEQTNMVFWAMWSAPLEIAADLRSIAPASKGILQNADVIAVNQVRAPTYQYV